MIIKELMLVIFFLAERSCIIRIPYTNEQSLVTSTCSRCQSKLSQSSSLKCYGEQTQYYIDDQYNPTQQISVKVDKYLAFDINNNNIVIALQKLRKTKSQDSLIQFLQTNIGNWVMIGIIKIFS